MNLIPREIFNDTLGKREYVTAISGTFMAALQVPSAHRPETDEMIYIVNARSTSTSPISCISLVKLPRNCQVQSALARLITTLFRSCPALIIPFSVKILDSIYSRIYIRTDDFKFYLKFYLILLLYWYNFIEWKSIFRSIYWQKNWKITIIYLL